MMNNLAEITEEIRMNEQLLKLNKENMERSKELIERSETLIDKIKKIINNCVTLQRLYWASGFNSKKYRDKAEEEYKALLKFQAELYAAETKKREYEQKLKDTMDVIEKIEMELERLRNIEAELSA